MRNELSQAFLVAYMSMSLSFSILDALDKRAKTLLECLYLVSELVTIQPLGEE